MERTWVFEATDGSQIAFTIRFSAEARPIDVSWAAIRSDKSGIWGPPLDLVRVESS